MTVDQILGRARAAAQELAPFESSALFAAAIRLAAAQGATLRSQLVQLDASGQVTLLPFDDRTVRAEPGYLAPELTEGDAANLKMSEPRVQVFAAGALGYELVTGRPPPDPRTGPGPELAGPLGDIVRLALAADRRERFGDLTQLADAVIGVQPRLGAERERQVFTALLARASKWGEQPPGLSAEVEKLAARFEETRARVDRFQAHQAELLERLERYEDGQRRSAGSKKASSPFVPAALAAILAAALTLGGAYALGLLREPVPAAPPAVSRAQALPEPKEAPPAAEPEAKRAPPEQDQAAPDAGALAAAAAPAPAAVAPDAGQALAASAPAAPQQAEPAARAEPAPEARKPAAADAEPAPEVPRPARSRTGARSKEPVSTAGSDAVSPRMAHAVAQSQVNRGEKALELGRLEEALASFHEALDNEAGLAVAYRGLGMAYAMQSNDPMALQSYQKYLSLAPGAADAADIRKAIQELKSRAKIGGADDK